MSNVIEDIAVIGMACRFPGAINKNQYWEKIHRGKDSISRFTHEELIEAGIPASIVAQKDYILAKGILESVDKFDNHFFGYSNYLATITDPQHRVILEIAWGALEDAGYALTNNSINIGVYMSCSESSYLSECLTKDPELFHANNHYQINIANQPGFIATKIAYALNLTGPCINVSSACSSSAVAVIMACRALQTQDCDIAIAGGVSIRVPIKQGYLFQKGSIFSKDSYCRAFDHKASGTVVSDGAGIIVLKRLRDAIADRDTIDAVIKGYAINNDGNLKVGYTAPSIVGQSNCVQLALRKSGIHPDTLGYIEAHGTGTQLGDPIEIAALKRAFNKYTKRKQYCALGSVKANIGHTDTAAGIAGIIKAVMILKKQVIPPLAHYQSPNEAIPFTDSPFYVPTQEKHWSKSNFPRRVGVSSFGIGGTNTHIILEELSSQQINEPPELPFEILTFSAKSTSSLERIKANLAKFIEEQKKLEFSNKSTNVANIIYTMNIGRNYFPYKDAILVDPFKEEPLLDCVRHNIHSYTQPVLSQKKLVTFIFTGCTIEPNQIPRNLYLHIFEFRKWVDIQFDYIKQKNILDKKSLFLEKNNISNSNQYPNVISFIVEYALAKMFVDWGITPDQTICYGIGEYVAATLSGVFELRDIIEIIIELDKIKNANKYFYTILISASSEYLSPYLNDTSLQIEQKTQKCSVSGKVDELLEIISNLLDRKVILITDIISITKTLLITDTQTGTVFKDLRKLLLNISLKVPITPFMSCLTGNLISNELAQDINYWISHIKESCYSTYNLDYLTKNSENTQYLVLGKADLILQLIKHSLPHEQVIYTLSEGARKINDYADLYACQEALKNLWLNGQTINWAHYYKWQTRSRIHLPTYPFERNLYWKSLSKLSQKREKIIKSEQRHKKVRFYIPYWYTEYSEIDLAYQPTDVDKTYILFFNESNFSKQLLKYLAERQQKVLLVTKGTFNKKLNANTYTINPLERNCYYNLFNDIKKQGFDLIHIYYCWSLDIQEECNTVPVTEYISILQITQCFNSIFHNKAKLIVFSRASQVINSDEIIHPYKSLLESLCMIIEQQKKLLQCAHIDISLETVNSPNETIICKYLGYANTLSMVNLSCRGEKVWQQKFKPFDLNKIKRNKSPIIKGGIYLITGGLGKIGLLIAECLARSNRVTLILVSRTPISIRSTKEKLEKIQKLMNMGSQVEIYNLDISKSDQVKGLISELSKKHSTVNGIIHAAGITGSSALCSLEKIDQHQVKHQLAAKVYGIHNLEKYINFNELDFVILFSSISSILGGENYGIYAAVNRYLDAYVEQKKRHYSTRLVVIDWDKWENTKYNDYSPLTLDEGMRAFLDILHSKSITRVIVTKSDLTKRLQRIKETYANRQYDLTKVYSDRNKADIESLKHLLSEQLCIKEFYSFCNWKEVDSLTILDVTFKINSIFKTNLTIDDIYNTRTVNQLYQLIQQKITLELLEPQNVVVTIQEGGNKRPLFLIHPIYGNTSCYAELVSCLDKERPVYGVQDPNMSQKDHVFFTLEEMATYYIQQIKTKQATGPYLLAGLSFGATVAFEMSKQLSNSGEKIDFVGLLDGWALFSKQLKNKTHFLASMEKKLQTMQDFLDIRHQDKESWFKAIWKRMELLLNYKPKQGDYKISLFKADTLLPEYASVNSPFNYWDMYATNIELYMVPGNHDSLIRLPNVKVVAEIINKNLEMI